MSTLSLKLYLINCLIYIYYGYILKTILCITYVLYIPNYSNQGRKILVRGYQTSL